MAKRPIEPDHKPHQSLEAEVTQFLESLEYLVDSATYHDKMEKITVKKLQNTYTPTALYIRGRADRIAIHKTKLLVFEWEAKTHENQKYDDITLEALPLCHHIAKAALGVECLYCYKNPHKGHEAGFWVHNLPTPRIIMIPGRWDDSQRDWFESVFRKFLPDIEIIRTGHMFGSGDPFLIINESEIEKMPHWKELIREKTEYGTR